MDETAEEIRQREEQQTNDVPELEDSGEVDSSGGSSLPIPSLSKRHVAIIGGIVVVLVAVYLYQSRSASSGSSLSEEREKLNKTQTAEASSGTDGEQDERIEVPIDPADPLAADRAVIQAFRGNGKLKDPEEPDQ